MTNGLAQPFLTRDMLDFEHGMTLSIQISTQGGVTTPLHIRGFTKSGPFSFRHTPTDDFANAETIFRIHDFPIYINVEPAGSGLVQGDIFANLFLLINGDIALRYCTGWVYEKSALAWPLGQAIDRLPGGGKVMTVAGSNPAAGVQASVTVPANQIWKVNGVRVTLVTDATAATRWPHIQITDGTTVLYETIPPDGQTASLTREWYFNNVGAERNSGDATVRTGHIPADLILPAGYVVKTAFDQFQAGDNFGAITLHIGRFIQAA